MNPGPSEGDRRPPPSKCIICHKRLLRYERDEKRPRNFVLCPIVTLKCGHLLHTKCTIEFFQSQGNTDCDELKNCPCCGRKNRWCDMRRILLTQSPNDKHTSDNNLPEPTPSLCTICHEYLLSYEDNQSDSLRPVLALKCGHLLHTACNNEWFLKQKATQEEELKECAYCRRKNRWCDTIRILLTLE